MEDMMDINSKPGSKVKVTKETSKHGYNYDKEQVKKYLKINKEYTIDFIDIHNWSSEVFLVEFPGISFNTVNFVNAEHTTENKNSPVIKGMLHEKLLAEITPSELKETKKQMLKEIDDNKKYLNHEMLDRLYLISYQIEKFLQSHPVYKDNKEIKKLIDTSIDKLSKAYQIMGSLNI